MSNIFSTQKLTWPAGLLLITVLLFLNVGCAKAPFEPGDSPAQFTAYLDHRVPALMKKYQIPGVSMALIHQGEIVWSGAYGYADLAAEREMTVEAVCRAESISKSVTAWGVMRLVEEGLLDLDAPVQPYLDGWQLPESPYEAQKVTVGGLLSNSAGMPPGSIGEEYVPQSKMPTLRDNLNQEAVLVQEPGAGFLYSNPGFNVLELLVEAVTERDFTAYMHEEVLIPLGMDESSYAWRDSYRDAIPVGYDMRGNPVQAYVYPASASGGLFADVEELARFVSAEMLDPYAANQSVLNPNSIRQLQTPRVEIPGLFGFVADSYGLGHFTETLPDGRMAVWHGGQGHGWMTHFHAVPESGEGIVILTNSQRSWPFIAGVLADWAKWIGAVSVKFSIILKATKALKVFIGFVVLITLWQAVHLGRGIRCGIRKFAPLAAVGIPLRITQSVLGFSVIAAVLWSAAQPYLFVSSIFPGTIRTAAAAALAWAVSQVLAAFFPCVIE